MTDARSMPVDRVDSITGRLRAIDKLVRSADEPSVYLPTSPDFIDVNFLGLDSRTREAGETYVLEDAELPLMVFGPLGLLRPGPVVEVEGLRLPLPLPADLIVEKLLTDRPGEKGARDLLVVAGLLAPWFRSTRVRLTNRLDGAPRFSASGPPAA